MKIKSLPSLILGLYILLIFLLTCIPGNSFPQSRFLAQNDKIVHFVEYAILGFLFINALESDKRNLKGLLVIVIILIIIPFIDENIQRFIPGRFPDIADGVADVVGGGLGAIIRFRIR